MRTASRRQSGGHGAHIVRMLALTLSLAVGDLLFLGLLVLIRATVSFFLDREINTIRRELDT